MSKNKVETWSVIFPSKVIREKWVPAGNQVLAILRGKAEMEPLEAAGFLNWLLRFISDSTGVPALAWEWQEPTEQDAPDEPKKVTVQ